MKRTHKPLIGIGTVHNGLRDGMYSSPEYFAEWIESVGGLPVLLPNLSRANVLDLSESLDGLLLPSGPDIPARYYGEAPLQTINDAPVAQIETALNFIKAVLKQKKPMLGVCLGHQLMNIAFGGKLIQDIPTERPDTIKHNGGYRNGKNGRFYGRRHVIYLEAGSMLSQLCETNKFTSLSYHHQAVKTVGRGVKVSARASDGIIEATEFPTDQLTFSVQWHPEMEKESPYSRVIFRSFVDACRIMPWGDELTRAPKPNPAQLRA